MTLPHLVFVAEDLRQGLHRFEPDLGFIGPWTIFAAGDGQRSVLVILIGHDADTDHFPIHFSFLRNPRTIRRPGNCLRRFTDRRRMGFEGNCSFAPLEFRIEEKHLRMDKVLLEKCPGLARQFVPECGAIRRRHLGHFRGHQP